MSGREVAGRSRAVGLACAFGAAGLGVVAFHAAALPLPCLLGPIFGCLLAALAGLPALWPTPVPVMTLAIGLIGVPYFRRVCRYDPATASYAAMPGGL